MIFFFNDTATTEIYTLSLHALFRSCSTTRRPRMRSSVRPATPARRSATGPHLWSSFILTEISAPRPRLRVRTTRPRSRLRSEEHTSELQSQSNIVCRLLLAEQNYDV